MADRLEVSADEIHLWLAFYDEIDDPALHARYRALMSRSERDQEPRFHFARDRRRYLVTRALVRTVLSRYADLAPAQWEFRTNPYGRPEIANVGLRGGPIAFNLSHTHSLIILGVTRHRALGVDVENLQSRSVCLDIANHCFARTEVEALAQTPAEMRQERFFEFWTLKESYIKARGMGLSLPLQKFQFSFPAERRVHIDIDADLNDDPRRWCFWQFRPAAPYLAAVCAQQWVGPKPVIAARKAVPLCSEEVLAPEFLRLSQ
jgi:4'-phosphopantetheinyl transferase